MGDEEQYLTLMWHDPHFSIPIAPDIIEGFLQWVYELQFEPQQQMGMRLLYPSVVMIYKAILCENHPIKKLMSWTSSQHLVYLNHTTPHMSFHDLSHDEYIIPLFITFFVYCPHPLIFGQMASILFPFSQQQARSYQNLDSACHNATKKNGYSLSSSWAQLSALFHAPFGSDPYEWQLDITEAILLGLDSSIIAGTGSGKMIPFMLPLLLDNKKKVVILSSLKVLQEDQVSSFFIF